MYTRMIHAENQKVRFSDRILFQARTNIKNSFRAYKTSEKRPSVLLTAKKSGNE